MTSTSIFITEDTYRYLAAAHHQFVFGRSGPVTYPGESKASFAYEVVSRTQAMRPGVAGGEASDDVERQGADGADSGGAVSESE